MSVKPELVIGANGYLGSHVARQLGADGHDVRVMVRDGADTIGIDDRGRGCVAAVEVHTAACVLRPGHVGLRRGHAAWHRLTAVARLRLMRAEAQVDCAKARRELGCQPGPVEESLREAARFWVGLRDAKRRSRQAG